MAKKNENRIPDTYWATTVGKKVATLMHGDAQDALDLLNEIDDGMTEAVENEMDEAMKAELITAQKRFKDSLNSFRKAFYGMSKQGF
ncbi:MAG: hypothetical protein PHS41_11370, partial [Victivallaceae bacterium]|nr:hypothetical protein [Victivallaceae bacterium]